MATTLTNLQRRGPPGAIPPALLDVAHVAVMLVLGVFAWDGIGRVITSPSVAECIRCLPSFSSYPHWQVNLTMLLGAGLVFLAAAMWTDHRVEVDPNMRRASLVYVPILAAGTAVSVLLVCGIGGTF